MNLIYQSSFLQALGWSLVDSLWQMGILWLLYITLTFNGKRSNAPGRHTLAVLALGGGFAWFIANTIFNYYSVENGGSFYDGLAVSAFFHKLTPFISVVYLSMMLFFGLRWVARLRTAGSMYDRCPTPLPGHFELLLNDLKHLTGFKKDVRLWLSQNITTPLTTGFLKPVILFPIAALSQLSLKQTEALIVHEFFHIRRNDYLVNLFISIADIIFFFNPFARLLQAIIKKERENACDDEVLRLGYDNWEYAQALYLLGRNDAEDYRFALAATGKNKQLLLQRIKRMMNRKHSAPSVVKPTIAFFLCLLLAGSINRNTINEETTSAIEAESVQETVIQVSETDGPVFVKQTVIIEKKTSPKKKHTAKITRLVLPASPPSPPPPPTEEDLEETEDIFIASYISYESEAPDFSFVPSAVAEFQKPESCSPNEPFLPNSTFYFPTHEILTRENGKTTIQL